MGYWYREDGEVVGVGIYDAVTGETTHLDIDSELGLSPSGIVWVGDRLWFDAPHFTDDARTEATGKTTYLWEPGQSDLREVPLDRSPSFGNYTTTDDEVVESEGRKVRFYSPDDPPRALRLSTLVDGSVAVSPDGSRMAGVVDPDGKASFSDSRPSVGVVVLTPDGHGGTASRRIPGLLASQVLAWRDNDHVIAWTRGDDAYESVDVDTGAAESLTTPGPSWVPGTHVAQDAWTAPTYHATAPPDPLSPRLVTAAAVGVLVVGGLVLFRWRRRVRA